MKQFKGTPGPWVFDDLAMKIKGSGDVEGMTVIANVSPRMDYSRGMTTQCRNAVLISKAPEMLHLLNSMMLSMKAHPDYMSGENQEFIDYVKMAEAMEATGFRATSKEGFTEVFAKALDMKTPVVIDCVINCDDKVYPMVSPGAPIQDAFDDTDLKIK